MAKKRAKSKRKPTPRKSPRKKKTTRKKATKKRPAADNQVVEDPPPREDAPASTSERIDRDLAKQALEARRAGRDPTRRQLQALKRVEKLEEERTRWRYYRTIPQKHYKQLSGRQLKVLQEQAERYGLPFNKAEVDLEELLPALHNFLADNAHVLLSGDGLFAGPQTESLERLRLAQAERVEMQNEETRGKLRPASDVHRVFAEIAAVLRDATDELVRTYGDGAREILAEAIDRGQQQLEALLSDCDNGTS